MKEEDDSDSDIVKHTHWNGRKKELWPFEEDDEGHALLPTVDEDISLSDLKDLVRSFVTHAYSKYHSTSFPGLLTNKVTFFQGFSPETTGQLFHGPGCMVRSGWKAGTILWL
jgi:hypothetical protein